MVTLFVTENIKFGDFFVTKKWPIFIRYLYGRLLTTKNVVVVFVILWKRS